jgi:sugar-specific transcriptional regulator TrmB
MVDKNLTLLRSLGLSKPEALVYLTLVKNPKGETVEEVSAECGLPLSSVQTTLVKMFEKGLIKVEGNRFEALTPKQALDVLIKRKEEVLERKLAAARNLALSLEKSLEPLYWEKRLGLRPEEILQPLEDLNAMEVQTAKIISSAKRELFIFAESFGWYEKVRRELLKAIDQGVKSKVLMMVVDKSSAKRASELKRHGAEVKRCAEEWYPVRGTLVDNEKLVFLIWATRKKDMPTPIYYKPHYTTNAGLIRIFADAFQRRWEMAKTI